MYKTCIVFSIIMFFGYLTTAQVISNVTVEFGDNEVIVHYDLHGSNPDKVYEVYLYSSVDNYEHPLQLVTGEVGPYVMTGKDKVMYWNAREELGNFKGEVNLKVKGIEYVPFVIFDEETEDLKIKKGKTHTFAWKPNVKCDEVIFEIYKDGFLTRRLLTIPNKGEYVWQVPMDIKPGSGYNIRISNANNRLQGEFSKGFTVKRKVPLAYKIAPVATLAIGGAIIMMLDDKSSNNGIADPPDIRSFNE